MKMYRCIETCSSAYDMYKILPHIYIYIYIHTHIYGIWGSVVVKAQRY